MRRYGPSSLLLFSLAVALFATGCPPTTDVPPVRPPVEDPPEVQGEVPVGAAPLRRLTQEELNTTLRDLFTRAGVRIEIPFVPLNDGEVGVSGTPFEGDVTRQSPSDLMVEQLRAGAIAVSSFAIADRDRLLPRAFTAGNVDEEKAVAEEFIAEFLPRAFRRSVDAGELETYAAFFRARYSEHNLDVALQLVLQAILQSPSFVYRIEIGGGPIAPANGDEPTAVALQPHEIASRLSYLLWGSMPDEALFAAAQNGELVTAEQIEAQARRMLADDKARDAVLSFHRQWLDLDAVLRQNKDAATYPEWNDELRFGLRDEIDAMIEEAIFGGGDARLSTLLSTTTTRVDANVAALYGIAAPAGGRDDLIQLPGAERAGVLTSGAFLSSRAHQVFGSPVLRGVFILDRFLCEKPPPPDPSIDVTPPDETDQTEPTTNRSRYAQHTFDETCQGCHAGIDGIGFGLENYDAIGKFRSVDNGFPVDASGNFDGSSLGGTFTGGIEMSALLASSDLVQDCVARQWLAWSRGRPEQQDDAQNDLDVLDAFRASEGDIRELLVAIAVSPAFRSLPKGGAP